MTNWSREWSWVLLAAALVVAPAVAAGAPYGDATPGSTRPMVLVVNPGQGAVVGAPFRIQVLVHSPTAAGPGASDVTAVQYTTDGTAPSCGSSTAGFAVNGQYDGGNKGAVWEGQVTLGAGNYTLRVCAKNPSGVVEAVPVTVTVGAGAGDGKLLVRDNASQLCTDCHALQSHTSQATGNKYGSWAVSCRGCHTPHATRNVYLVGEQLTPPAVNGVQPTRSVYFSNTSGDSGVAGGTSPEASSYVNADNSGPCQVCHTRTANPGTGAARYQATGNADTHYTGAGTANCASCHGHKTGFAASCTGCHGDPARADVTIAPAPPKDVSGQVASAKVGAHLKHLTGTTFRAVAIGCNECHVSPPVGTHPRVGNPPANITFGTLATTAWAGQPAINPTTAPSGGTVSCAATYCHGNFVGGTAASPVWSETGTVTCGSCHGIPPAVTKSGTHPAGACGTCHGGSYTSTTIDPVRHMNGLLEVAAMTCSGCHGDASRTVVAQATGLDAQGQNLVKDAPPVDASGGSPGRAGGHLAHLNRVGLKSPPVLCTDCHVVPTTTGHSDGTAQVAFSAFAGSPGATWNKGATSCGTVYCHGAFTGGKNGTPTWSGAAMTCNDCHGAGAGAAATTPALPHPPATDCARCHGAGYSTTTVLATTHVNGVVERTPSSGCGQCHGDALRTFAGVSGADLVNGIAAPPYDASGSTSNTGRKVGAHLQHVGNTLSPTSRAVACTECHAVALPTGTDTTHADGVTAIGFTLAALAKQGPVTPAWNSGATTCASTYCHGNFVGGNAGNVPNWTNPASGNCGTCHGVGSNPLPPLSAAVHHPQNASCGTCHAGYTNVTTNGATHVDGTVQKPTGCTACHGDVTQQTPAQGAQVAAGGNPLAGPGYNGNALDTTGGTNKLTRGFGAHGKHLVPSWRQAGIRCDECHVVPADGDVSHATGPNATLAWGNLARTGSLTPTAVQAANVSCSANWCHGGSALLAGGTLTTNVPWNNGTTMSCTSCHGDPPVANGHPNNPNCASCHGAGYTNSSVSGAALSTHIDGTITVVGGTSCTSCHGNGGRGSVAGADGFQQAAPPNDTTGQTATTGVKVGVHVVHVNGTRSKPTACAECHTGAVPGATQYTHGNGTTTVAFGATAKVGPVTPVYGGSGSPTCATSYCHGNFAGGNLQTPTWTAAGTLACNTCHLAPPVPKAAGATPVSYHPGNANCAACHPAGYTSTTITGGAVATHVDGTVETLRTGCTACHGDFTQNNVTSGSIAAAPGNTAGAVDSHGNTLTTAAGVGAHQVHVTNGNLRNALACTECHVLPANGDKTHIDGGYDFGWGALSKTGGASPVYAGAGGTCATVYCHGTNLAAGGSRTIPTWTVVTPGACGTCHALPPPLAATSPHPRNMSCVTCHGAGYVRTGPSTGTVSGAALAIHVNGTTDLNGRTGCTLCHGDLTLSGVSAATPLSAAPGVSANAADVTGATATTAFAVGAHAGHLTNPVYRSATIACTECHVVPVNGDVAHATGVGTNGARATLTWGGLATGSGWSTIVPTYTLSTTGAVTPTSTGSCNNYCHGNFKNGVNGSISWTAVGSLTCNSCHLSPPGGTHTGNTNCANCHGAGYAQGSVTGGALATHIDGTVQLSGMNCSSCHGDGARTAVATATVLDPLGANIVKAAPPADAGGTSPGRAGTHLAHVNQGSGPALSNALTCTLCHGAGVSSYTLTHASGTTNVTFTGIASASGATFTPAAHSCASTYCHGNFTGGNSQTPVWTAAGKLACTTCHLSPPVPKAAGATPASYHPNNANCAACHPAGYTGTTVTGGAVATHVDGTVTKLRTGCTACHGDFTQNNVLSGAIAAAPGNTAGAVDSHGNTLTTAAGVGAHQVHVTNGNLRNALACGECHLVPANGDVTHVDGAYDFGWGALSKTGGASPVYAGAGGTCATVYCHGTNLAAGGSRTIPTWTVVTPGACGTCHALPPPLSASSPHPQNTTCANCHGAGYVRTGPSAGTVSGAALSVHVNGTTDLNGRTGCTLCHGDLSLTGVAAATPNSAAPGLTAGSVDASGNTDGQTNVRGIGAHRVHLNASSSASITCAVCHAVPANGDQTHATGPNATVTISGLGAAAGAAYNSGALTCASTYCHGNWAATSYAAYGLNATPTWTNPASGNCGTCHGLPPGGAHPANDPSGCGACHPGYTNTTVNPALHVNGQRDGGEGGAACGTCHTNNYNRMNGTLATTATGSAIVTRHTMPTTGGDTQTDSGASWGNPLNANAVAARSCVNMCHNDHSHTPDHATNVYSDAGTAAARAGTKAKTDYENTATGGMCLSCHRNPVESGQATHPALVQATYQASAHNYVSAAGVTWQYTLHDNSTFDRNCTKCHSNEAPPTNAATATELGAVHFSPNPSLLSGTDRPATTQGTLNTARRTGFICFNCHGNGTIGTDRSGKDIASEVNLANTPATSSGHPTDLDATHNDVAEFNNSAFGAGLGAGVARHVACNDCHEPHAALPTAALGRYTTGTVALSTTAATCPTTNGFQGGGTKCYTVTGTGTTFTSAMVGWFIRNNATGATYVVAGYTSATSIVVYSNAAPAAWAAGTAYTLKQAYRGNNLAQAPLQGAWGVPLGTLAAWTAPTAGSFGAKKTIVAGTDLEATLCFKCHTAYYGTLPTAPSSSPAYTETDVAKEFNPNNVSIHPVLGSALSKLGATSNVYPPFSRGATMTCSDCHASDLVTDPEGPHGSASRFALKGPNTKWDATVTLGSSGMPANTFCANCHRPDFAGGRFTNHTNGKHNVTCMTCHSGIPHGGPRPGMLNSPLCTGTGTPACIAGYDNTAPYWQGGTNKLYLASYPANNTTAWGNGNCGCNSASAGH